MTDISLNAHLTLTGRLVAAYLANHELPNVQLPSLIEATYASLANLGSRPPPAVSPEPASGAVSVRKSLASPHHILSMIDGKPYRTLKRHLAIHGLTPDQYCILYKLPADYPMVAPAYSAERSALAKSVGLGRRVPGPPVPRRPILKIAIADSV